MTEQSVGSARVDLLVNTDQFQAEVARAKNLSATLGPEFERSVSKMTPASRRATLEALKLAQQTKLTREEVRLLGLAARGAAPDALEAYRKSLLATRQEAEKSGKALNLYGMSAAQHAAALRNVPAQLTDIVVGLQGGQQPLTVLLQQGGQLKDMFGGIVPAAKALGGAALGLVNPFTLAAGAIGALLYAYHEGSSELDRFKRILVETGGISGKTAGELSDLARSSVDVVGSQSRAADAIAAVESTGKVASRSLKEVSEATALYSRATDQSADKVAAVFAKLADEPTKAVAALNEQYHFLSAATYDRIRSLEDQGQKEQAAALAQQTLASAFKFRAQEIRGEAGTLERAWFSLGEAARKAWDSMLNIGRPTPIDELRKRAGDLQRTIDELKADQGFVETAGGAAIGGGANRAAAGIKRAAAELAATQQEISEREKAGAAARSSALKQQAEDVKIAGESAYKAYVDSRKGVTLSAAIKAENDAFETATKTFSKDSEKYRDALTIHNAKVADIQKQFANKGKGPAVRDDAATRMLAEFSQGNALLLGQLDTRSKIGRWEQRSLKFEQEIADLKSKKILTADQKTLLARQDELRVALARNVAAEKNVQIEQDKAKVLALQQTLQSQLGVDRRQYDEDEAALGLGSKEQQRMRERVRIYRDYQRDIDRLTEQHNTGKIQDALFQQETALYKSNLDDRLATLEEHYRRIDALQASWLVGANAGLSDYADMAANSADLSASAFTAAFQGIEDFGVDAITKLKLNFRDLGSVAQSVLADIARMLIRQNVTGPAAGWLNGVLKGIIGGVAGGITAGNGYVSAGPAVGGSSGAGSFESFMGIVGGRAQGGPTVANSLYQVVEKGEPELLRTRGKTFLMSGDQSGYVTPIRPPVGGQSGQGAPNIDVYNNYAAGVDVQARMDDDRIIFEINQRIAAQTPVIMDRQASNPNSRFSRQMSRSTTAQRRR